MRSSLWWCLLYSPVHRLHSWVVLDHCAWRKHQRHLHQRQQVSSAVLCVLCTAASRFHRVRRTHTGCSSQTTAWSSDSSWCSTPRQDARGVVLTRAGLTCICFPPRTQLLYFDVDPKALDDHASRRSVFTGIPFDIAHIVMFTAAAITGSGIAMACAIAGDAASYNDDNRARWYVELPVCELATAVGLRHDAVAHTPCAGTHLLGKARYSSACLSSAFSTPSPAPICRPCTDARSPARLFWWTRCRS